jgi:hypothetical protein
MSRFDTSYPTLSYYRPTPLQPAFNAALPISAGSPSKLSGTSAKKEESQSDASQQAISPPDINPNVWMDMIEESLYQFQRWLIVTTRSSISPFSKLGMVASNLMNPLLQLGMNALKFFR